MLPWDLQSSPVAGCGATRTAYVPAPERGNGVPPRCDTPCHTLIVILLPEPAVGLASPRGARCSREPRRSVGSLPGGSWGGARPLKHRLQPQKRMVFHVEPHKEGHCVRSACTGSAPTRSQTGASDGWIQARRVPAKCWRTPVRGGRLASSPPPEMMGAAISMNQVQAASRWYTLKRHLPAALAS